MSEPSLVVAFPGREAFNKGLDDSVYQSHPSAREAIALASDYLGKDVAAMCYQENNVEERWKSVCLAAHCYAIYRTAAPKLEQPHAFTGYSQGEFTACAAAGIFAYPEVLGLIFQLETILLEGRRPDEGMARIIGLQRDKLRSCCRKADPQGKQVYISAVLSSDQTMLSGRQPFLQEVSSLAKQQGAQWALPIPTGRAFHSPLCAGAADTARPLFDRFAVRDGAFVYSCYDGQRSGKGNEVCRKLSMQVDHPLQWRTLVRNLRRDGITRLVEIGPGCTVSANTRIADDSLQCQWIHSQKDVEKL